MATATSMRLPWRAIVRSVTTRPAPQYVRAAAPSIPQPFRRRYSSDSVSNPPIDDGNVAARPETTVEPGTEAKRIASNPDEASTSATATATATATSSSTSSETSQEQERERRKPQLNPADVRPPRAVQAVYLRPLRREAPIGLPVCDLQLRSYSIRNLEFFADFCMRAAYYLGLPAYGPVPLPRITERWTVPMGHFIHKKSQENFERKTLRRLIQIKDGDAETVEVWLAFVKKYAYYGIGMKANVWSFEKIGVGKRMDEEMEKMRGEVEPTLRNYAFKKGSAVEDKVLELINREDFKAASGGNGPMIRTPTFRLPKN